MMQRNLLGNWLRNWWLSLLCIVHLTESKQLNIDVTLHQRDACLLFPQYEVFSTEFVNKSYVSPIVKLNVVINDTKLDEIKANPAIIDYKIIYDDIEIPIKEERKRLDARERWNSTMKPDLFFLEYRDWIEYELFLEYILLEYPSIASKSFLSTQTIQGRDIPVITLSTGGNNKAGFFIQAEVHAREWLANMAVMWFLHALTEGYADGDQRIVNILDNLNIYIAPTINIDGYIYSWEVQRLWRKNRKNNGDGTFGVDLNRNYDGPIGTWCTTGASTNPSSDSYCGTAPFSEPEIQAVRDFVLDADNNLAAAWDMHTSGTLILMPWAYTSNPIPPPFNTIYQELGSMMQSAIFDVHGVNYEPIQTSDFCVCSGSSIDFFHSQSNGNTLGFGWEGRGPGFNPNPSNIIPMGQEQFAAVLALAETLF